MGSFILGELLLGCAERRLLLKPYVPAKCCKHQGIATVLRSVSCQILHMP